MMSRTFRVCLVLFLTLALVGSAAWAQQGSSSIRGTVTDPQGKVVPNAKVTLTNPATKFTRNQTTTAAGTFAFDLIPPGDYNVEITADGFRKFSLTNLRALIGNVVDASAQLEVGSVSEVVQVEATSTAVQVNTQDATLGNNIGSQQLTQLPLEARGVQALLTLQPGVTSSPDAPGYVAGARSDQSNVTLDGVDINEAQTNALASTVLRLNAEAIDEFRVNTVGANSNQGRSSGAQINLVTKSGTNSFHGSVFEFYRSTGFTANDFFLNRSGVPRQALIRHTFGGTVGGPVIKDKVFFFYSYEARRDRSQGSPATPRTVPLAQVGAGSMFLRVANCSSGCPAYQVTVTTADLNLIFPGVPGNPVGVNPAAVAVFNAAAAAYPANDFAAGDGINTAGFRFNQSTPVNLNASVAKIDWNINSKMTAFVRWTQIYDSSKFVGQFPDTPQPGNWSHPYGGTVSHNWTIGKNWVNNFRYGLTRQAFSNQGDSAENAISFRFVFSPRLFSRTLSRTTPVHNIVNDLSWIKGSHTFQFGANIRLISNKRDTFANSFDNAITNPSFYTGGGSVSLSTPIRTFLRTTLAQPALVIQTNSSAQNIAAALIGRFSQYAGNFLFNIDGTPQAAGTPSSRNFGTEEYDVYAQDTWKLTRNITLTYGLRYSISRPVYEKTGFEVKPNVPLNEFFAQRQASAFNGVNLETPLQLELSGPANGRSPMYKWDKNNFQPRLAVAWTPNFQNGFLHMLFGDAGKSVIRTGFGITNDYYGQSLAVAFDLNNTLGFSSSSFISANTYNTTNNPAPLFTGFNQTIRTLPGITVPAARTFPATPPSTVPSSFSRTIESSLDEGLVAPINYLATLTFERELPHGMVVQASYLGRIGRNLLASRDVMALSNLRDPISGVDWYTAATMLEKQRQQGIPETAVQPVPWFENFLPANYVANMIATYTAPVSVGGYGFPVGALAGVTTKTQAVYFQALNVWGNDWTDTQAEMEGFANRFFFFHPQYGALSSWGTIANSNYHGATLSVRQRLRGLLWDFNYTLSHSTDDASGLQTSGTFGTSFILNPIRQGDNYANSDFDIRHQINVNVVYELPFGRGKQFASNANRVVDAVIGGWQISGIMRWNTGLPETAPFDDARWATNWNVQSNATNTRAVTTCPDRGSATAPAKLFGCGTTNAVYQSWRNAYPGETGLRNVFRHVSYANVDLGLSKSFTMPWNERQKLQLRWEVFNVANFQPLGTIDGSRTGFGIQSDTLLNSTPAPDNWSNYTSIIGDRRVMQIAVRFEF